MPTRAVPEVAPEPALRVLSLDSGGPSLTVLLLAVQGQLPPFDLAIFADSTREPARIYADLARVQQIAIEAGVPILRLTSTTSPTEAITAKIREILGHPHPRPVPSKVVAELAFGVCLDEVHLTAASPVSYLRYRFPLLDLGWTRRDCSGYLRSLRLDNTSKPTYWRRRWAL
jgi:hypothetical protein